MGFCWIVRKETLFFCSNFSSNLSSLSHCFQQWQGGAEILSRAACQASVWFSCRDNYCISSAACSPWMKDDLPASLFVKNISLKFLFFSTAPHRVMPASWRNSKCSSEVKFWGSLKVQKRSEFVWDAFSLSFWRSECEFLFVSPCREAIERCHAAEDTCRHLSFTIPRASRTSWQARVTRPARRARTSWSSR